MCGAGLSSAEKLNDSSQNTAAGCGRAQHAGEQTRKWVVDARACWEYQRAQACHMGTKRERADQEPLLQGTLTHLPDSFI